MIKKKANFLNNKDLLMEIHISKNSFCEFIDKKYRNYDIILDSVSKINRKTINLAKLKRFRRLEREYKEGLINYKPKLEDIKTEDLVFRVFCDRHIPNSIKGQKKSRKNNKNILKKLNFQPFKHYILKDNNLIRVGRSHWRGDFENGHFSLTKGKITENLAKMLILLIERYARKSNWRGYSWIEDMKSQALLQLMETALKFDESKSENAFSYYTCIVTNSFRGSINSEDKNLIIRNKIMIQNGFNASFNYQIDARQDGEL